MILDGLIERNYKYLYFIFSQTDFFQETQCVKNPSHAKTWVGSVSDRWRSCRADPCPTSSSLSSSLSDTSVLLLLFSSFPLLLCCFCFFFWWRKKRKVRKTATFCNNLDAKWLLVPSCPSCVCAASCSCVSFPCSAFCALDLLFEDMKWSRRFLFREIMVIRLCAHYTKPATVTSSPFIF